MLQLAEGLLAEGRCLQLLVAEVFTCRRACVSTRAPVLKLQEKMLLRSSPKEHKNGAKHVLWCH